jgi:hypothetical protein
VIVVAHDTVDKYLNRPTIVDFTDGFEKPVVVLLVEKNSLPRTSVVHHMINSSGKLDTKRPRHESVVTSSNP